MLMEFFEMKVLKSLLIILCLTLSASLFSCAKEVPDVEKPVVEETEPEKIEIVSSETVSFEITAQKDLKKELPEKLKCSTSKGESIDVSVKEWKDSDFDTTKCGVYNISPVFSDDYIISPEFSGGVVYTVKPSNNLLVLEYEKNDVKTFCGSDPVLPAVKAFDEFMNPIEEKAGDWVCESFGNRKLGRHTFGFVVASGYTYTGEALTVNVDVELNPDPTAPYRAPEEWYSPVYQTGTLGGGDYKLEYGVMGLKVYYVEKALGMWASMWGYYKEGLINRVKSFQQSNGLEVTGVVDLTTWLKLGLNEKDWYELGTYIAPVQVNENSSYNDYINVIIETAKSYIGTPYVVGAAGKPGEGIDCSGLVLQCLYAIGIYPEGLDPVQHSTLEEYNSRLMWADPRFKSVERSELLPGDLVFYRGPYDDRVCHVAIYIGDGLCIEALPGYVSTLYIDKEWYNYTIKGYKRIVAK